MTSIERVGSGQRKNAKKATVVAVYPAGGLLRVGNSVNRSGGVVWYDPYDNSLNGYQRRRQDVAKNR
jgi:hypothetical protein